jgi:hypothetical protein
VGGDEGEGGTDSFYSPSPQPSPVKGEGSLLILMVCAYQTRHVKFVSDFDIRHFLITIGYSLDGLKENYR